jgi:alanine transaminase
MLCPPVIGQCMVEVMVNPPKEGSPSYELYKKEYDNIYSGLYSRAHALYNAFQKMEGVSCASPAYCMRLLEATGVCIVPGSGFGQKEGTLHFRTTFLAPGTEWVGRIEKFHKEFMDEFR